MNNHLLQIFFISVNLIYYKLHKILHIFQNIIEMLLLFFNLNFFFH